MPTATAAIPRPFCYACRRAATVCICADVTPIAPASTRLIFLQHEDEAWNQIGTARLAHLSLPGSLLLTGRAFDGDPDLARALAERPRSYLLFPTPDATPLEAVATRGEPINLPMNLVVIDGTWSQARRLVARTPAIRDLPRVRIPLGARSRYRIRLQPRAECLSTVEAAVRALGVLEGDARRFEPLLGAFDRMVDRQIARAAAAGRTLVRDLRAERTRRPFPPRLLAEPSRLVLVHGETLNARAEDGSLGVDLVQWAALRISTGEVLDLTLAPARPVSEREVRYLGLEPRDLAGGLDAPGIRAAWASFAREGDVPIAWGFFAANAFAAVTGAPLAGLLDLRDATKRLLHRPLRRPEDGLLELDLATPPPVAARGRAGPRLAALRSILTHVREGRAGVAPLA